MLENIVLDPKLYCADALFLRCLKRSVSSVVLWGEPWKNENGRRGVREVELEFRNRVCRVERRSDRSGQQEAMLAYSFAITWFQVGVVRPCTTWRFRWPRTQ